MEMPPTGRLPEDVTPRAYDLALSIDPAAERFSGEVTIEIELANPRDTIWLHGQGQRVSAVEVRADGATVAGEWQPAAGTEGVVALRLPAPIGPGRATLAIQYDAPWDPNLEGLYRVQVAGKWYAFTQFESIRARLAFPCFDEPRFKTPFAIRVTAPDGQTAISNTRETGSAPAAAGHHTVTYARTEPLPTYLLAFAVGPFDVREGPPLPAPGGGTPRPFRGVAPAGRGAELAAALAETPRMVAALERILGVPYPYDKLDVIAVPDFRSGAMENAGAITFREQLLLLGPNASVGQGRAFRSVMAHELAHNWFGNLVTMPWWNDIWLNEAFASWMGNRVVAELYPEDHAAESCVLSAQDAMGADSRVAARVIRQPILTNDDIENAFDSITYSKGAGVLGMFEAWLGRETFARGIRRYLEAHRFGTATSDDLLAALTAEAGGRDVGAAMRTFLDRPGVPLIAASLECAPENGGASVSLRQTRYLPVGSTGSADATWQVPVCVRVPGPGGTTRTACTLLGEREGRIALDRDLGCPAWVMPNANADGYYRFSLGGEALRALTDRGWATLSVREKLAVADSLLAGVANASIPVADALQSIAPLASEPNRRVADVPMELLAAVDEHMIEDDQRPLLQELARSLFRPRLARLGWSPRRGEDDDVRGDRADVIDFLAKRGRDPEVRARAAELGRKLLGLAGRAATPARATWTPEAVDPELHGVSLVVTLQDGDEALFDAVHSLLARTEDASVRDKLVGALAAGTSEALARRARALVFEEGLRENEVPSILWRQGRQRETREAAWAFVRDRYEDVSAHLARGYRASLPRIGAGFCDPARRAELERFFRPRVGGLVGAPRILALTLEGIDLCVAKKNAQAASARVYFESRAGRGRP